MRWVVAYREGNPPLAWFASENWEWESLPTGDGVTTGVVLVDVWHPSGKFRHRLSGYDYYWVHGDSFGEFNDPSNWDWYGGGARRQYLAWRWVDGGSERVMPATVPLMAHVLKGVMIPNEIAREHGLLALGESLPPRPR